MEEEEGVGIVCFGGATTEGTGTGVKEAVETAAAAEDPLPLRPAGGIFWATRPLPPARASRATVADVVVYVWVFQFRFEFKKLW